uniref:Predicted protein n=1 Tax=Hordeum vulgare subsp. vulgare TaxID=112509 RepID=F2DPF1_HORVV|nr:predicted protein [Hordeum vulgare subsp. vulgare]
MVIRWAEDTFKNDPILTLGVDFRIKKVSINEKLYKIMFWDHPHSREGPPNHMRLTASYVRNTDALLFMFSLDDVKSFDSIRAKYKEAIDVYRNYSGYSPSPIILLGSKMDLREDKEKLEKNGGVMITHEQGLQFAQEMGAVAYREFSSLSNQGFDEMMELIYQEASKYYESKPPSSQIKSKPPAPPVQQKSKCLLM